MENKEVFFKSFYDLCLSLGVIDQLIEKKYLDSSTSISRKGYDNITKHVLKIIPEEGKLDWVEEYRELFHNKRIGISGKKGDPKTVSEKLLRFTIQYPQYTKDMILKATIKYLKYCLANGIFIMDADNFIFKIENKRTEERSRLAVYCEELSETVAENLVSNKDM